MNTIYIIVDSQSTKTNYEGEAIGFHGGKKVKGRSRQIAREAITSRPMFLLQIAKMSTHQSMRTLVIFCAHVQAKQIQEKLEAAARRLKE